jgi:hypothetical protein
MLRARGWDPPDETADTPRIWRLAILVGTVALHICKEQLSFPVELPARAKIRLGWAAPSLVRIQPKEWPPLPPVPKLILFGPSLSLVPSQAREWPPLPPVPKLILFGPSLSLVPSQAREWPPPPVSAEINPVWTAAPASAGGTSQCSPAL